MEAVLDQNDGNARRTVGSVTALLTARTETDFTWCHGVQVLDALDQHIRSSCPVSTFSECDLQSLRKDSGGNNAMCPNQCTNVFDVSETSACLGHDEYPKQ
eukprot:SAG11_NODE_2616_length_3170_cov_1.068382_4_plen_100_part_01